MNHLKRLITVHSTLLVAALVLLSGVPYQSAHAAAVRVSAQGDCANGVIFTKDIDGKGPGEPLQICLSKGRGIKYASMPEGWNDKISSFITSTRILVYEHAGFKGKCLGIRGGEIWSNLTQIEMRPGESWNDNISSFVVNPSNMEWLKCR